MNTSVASQELDQTPLTEREVALLHACWRACNYLAVGMIYLQDNPLLREPLRVEHVKARLLGHWGGSPALSFVWTHLNRLIVRDDLDVLFVAGPDHGAPGLQAPAFLERIYSEACPHKSQNGDGRRTFSLKDPSPGQNRSHV